MWFITAFFSLISVPVNLCCVVKVPLYCRVDCAVIWDLILVVMLRNGLLGF